LTESQRAMVAAGLANLRGQGARKPGSIDPGSVPTSNEDAAKALNISAASVKRGKLVREHGTDEEKKSVEDGEASVSSVAKRIRERRGTAGGSRGTPTPGGSAGPDPRPEKPKPPPKHGTRRKHAQVIESLNTSLYGLTLAAKEITELDQTVTEGE